MAESVVKLSVDDSSFNAHIKRAAKEFADFGKNIASVGVDAFGKFAKGAETAKVAFQNFNKALKANAIMFVASLAIEAGQAIGEMIGNWISGANDAEAAQKKLNQEVEETIRLVRELDRESDFNTRAAKIMGKSTSDILQMKKDDAINKLKVIEGKMLSPDVKVGTEAWEKLRKEADKYRAAIEKVNDEIKLDKLAQQYKYGEYAPKRTGGGGRTKAKPEKLGGIYAPMAMAEGVAYSTPLADMTKAFTPDMSGLNALERLEAKIKSITEQQKIFGGVSSEVWQMFHAELERAEEDVEIFKGKNKSGAKVTNESWQDAAAAMESVGSALASIEDPSAKIAGLIGQAIANIALGFAQATASDSKLGVFGWIAAIAGGMATMLSTISAIHSATGYAQGGIVKGNSYSGDNIPAYLNAGETVLTAAQTNMLANNLRNGGLGNLNLTATVSGEQIRLALNNNGRRTGKGEYVQSSFVRI